MIDLTYICCDGEEAVLRCPYCDESLRTACDDDAPRAGCDCCERLFDEWDIDHAIRAVERVHGNVVDFVARLYSWL